MQTDVRKLLGSFVCNFIDLEIIKSTEDITSVNYTDTSIQLSDDELGIGTSARLMWCGDLEDMVGTALEQWFLNVGGNFMKQVFPK